MISRRKFNSSKSLWAWSILSGLASTLFWSLPAQAQSHLSTIDRIKESGTIRIGYGTTAPFSFVEDNGVVSGYSIDLCKSLTEEIRRTLGLSEIRIEYVARTPGNRVQLLNDGLMDIECASSTNTPERRKVASFSPPHYIAQTRFVSLAQNEIRSLNDLKGKSVSVVLGTVNVSEILKIGRDRKLNLASVPVDSVQNAFDLVSDGRVSAFAMDDILLASMVAGSGHAADYRLSEEVLAEPMPYGFMTRIDDRPFADLVAGLLSRIYAGPEMTSIYSKWFLQPIRDGRYCLCMPMTDELKIAMGIASAPQQANGYR